MIKRMHWINSMLQRVEYALFHCTEDVYLPTVIFLF